MIAAAPPGAPVLAVATHELPGAAVAAPAAPLEPAAWRRLVLEVTRERLAPLLARSAATGAFPVTDAQLDEALVLGREALGLVLELERELVGVHRDLLDAGIPMRVLKGPAIARMDEADPSNRAFGDIDVLVRPQDLRAAQAVIEARGGVRRHRSPGAAYDRYVGKGASFRFERNVEVDLHRTIAPGPFGIAVDLDELFAHHEPAWFGPAAIDALDRPGRFLHACYHAALGRARPRRSAQRDVVLTAPADADELDVVRARARRWRGELVIAAAVADVVGDLRWRPPAALDAWVGGYDGGRRERRWLEAYRSDDRSSARLTRLGFGAAGTGIGRARYAAGVVGPRVTAAISARVRPRRSRTRG